MRRHDGHLADALHQPQVSLREAGQLLRAAQKGEGAAQARRCCLWGPPPPMGLVLLFAWPWPPTSKLSQPASSNGRAYTSSCKDLSHVRAGPSRVCGTP